MYAAHSQVTAIRQLQSVLWPLGPYWALIIIDGSNRAVSDCLRVNDPSMTLLTLKTNQPVVGMLFKEGRIDTHLTKYIQYNLRSIPCTRKDQLNLVIWGCYTTKAGCHCWTFFRSLIVLSQWPGTRSISDTFKCHRYLNLRSGHSLGGCRLTLGRFVLYMVHVLHPTCLLNIQLPSPLPYQTFTPSQIVGFFFIGSLLFMLLHVIWTRGYCFVPTRLLFTSKIGPLLLLGLDGENSEAWTGVWMTITIFIANLSFLPFSFFSSLLYLTSLRRYKCG